MNLAYLGNGHACPPTPLLYRLASALRYLGTTNDPGSNEMDLDAGTAPGNGNMNPAFFDLLDRHMSVNLGMSF